MYYSRCFTKDIGHAMDILGDILLHSRHTILLEMEDVFTNKYEVVFDLLHATAYQGCGLGYTILGPERNIRSMQRQDLVDYVQTHYIAPRVVVAGAGALSHEHVCARSGGEA